VTHGPLVETIMELAASGITFWNSVTISAKLVRVLRDPTNDPAEAGPSLGRNHPQGETHKEYPNPGKFGCKKVTLQEKV